DKEKAGNSPACPDLYSLIFRLTIYIAQMLSNLTVCFERKVDIRVTKASLNHPKYYNVLIYLISL
ncbi:TPA: hypothetical protein ACULAC_003842, partial [Escherichia coli]